MELSYRCIPISAWANVVLPKNQTQRELLIAIHKLERFKWQDELHFMMSVDSIKRSKKLGEKKSKLMGLQYERVVGLVGKACQQKLSCQRYARESSHVAAHDENG
jgi:hypothetical protein